MYQLLQVMWIWRLLIWIALADELKGLMGVPDQVLKGAHARKIAMLPPNQETRNSLSYSHDGIFRSDSSSFANHLMWSHSCWDRIATDLHRRSLS